MELRQYEELKEKLCKELENITKKNSLNMGDVETIDKLVHSIKNIYKIEEEEGGGYSQRMYNGRHSRGEYSQDGNWNARGSYGDGYGRGNSYARSGMHYVRGHYSRDDGSEMITERIEEMMNEGNISQSDKETLRRAMDVLRK